MKPLTIALVFVLWMPAAPIAAQEGRLRLPEFRGLEQKATESVTITLNPWLLRSISTLMTDADAESVSTIKLLTGISVVQVRNFEFDTDFAYPMAEVDAVRRQLSEPGWTQLMAANNRKQHQDVDIYLMIEGNRTKGFALIASEARQLTISNVVGSIALEDLPALERQLHLPNLAAPLALL